MSDPEVPSRPIGRRKFLQWTGGIAAVGVASAAAGVGTLAAACGDPGGTYEKPGAPPFSADQTSAAATLAAATPTTTPGSDRPKASGQLASVYDAALKPADPSPSKTLLIQTRELTHEVAAGVTMDAWTFDGVVPGNVVHIRQGDSIAFTLHNGGTMGHSIDFHAAQTPWNINYRTILPGQDLSFNWKPNYPGTFLYHCGTGPVLQHLINGMYGAIVVDPVQPLAPAREYVLVQSEFYLSKGKSGNWDGDLARASAVTPDFVTFNGAANQYQQKPLQASVGELIRLHVVNAGPTLFSAFHVIGAIFDKVYPDGNPANVLRGVQTWTIPPGGGAMFELIIPEAGQYLFVTHSFAYTGLGAAGVIEVK